MRAKGVRIGLAYAAAWALVAATPAGAATPPIPEIGFATPRGADVQHLHFKYGPIAIAPGQNTIMLQPVTIEKPAYNGYVIDFKPHLVRADGTVPPVDEIHLHHGVSASASSSDGIN